MGRRCYHLVARSVALLTTPAIAGAAIALSSRSRAWLGHGTLPVYAFNKPVGLTTSHALPATRGRDGRKLVLNDYAEMAHETMRPASVSSSTPIPTAVGRLDKKTSGLIFLTADGTLQELLLRPGLLPKVYEATVRLRAPAVLTDAQLGQMRDGCELSDGIARAEAVEVLDSFTIHPPGHPRARPARSLQLGLGPSKRSRLPEGEAAAAHKVAAERTAAAAAARALPDTHAYRLRVTMRIGRNRVVRRMLAAAGLPCFALRRVAFGPLSCDDFGEAFAEGAPGGGLAVLTEAQEASLRRACALAEAEAERPGRGAWRGSVSAGLSDVR